MTRVVCAECQEEGRDGCLRCGLKRSDTDSDGTEIGELARQVRRIAVRADPTNRDIRTIADALGVALERLHETRRLVDALIGPVVVHGPVEYKWHGIEPSGRTTVSLEPESGRMTVEPERTPAIAGLKPGELEALALGARCATCGHLDILHRFSGYVDAVECNVVDCTCKEGRM